MPETFYVYQRAIDVRPLEDGLFAVFNDEASDLRRYLELVNLRLSPVAPTSSNGAAVGRAGQLSLYRTTAQSGGDVISPMRYDTARAALPSQVVCCNNPSSVTVSGAQLRRIADAPTFFLNVANSSLATRGFSSGLVPGSRDSFAEVGRFGSADCEAVILRENEGIAVLQDEYGTPHSMVVSFIVTNLATGATYQFRSVDVSTDATIGGALIALFNGSGSGVVLAVRACVLPLDGEVNPGNVPGSNVGQGLRVARISGLDTPADTATVVAADTTQGVPASMRAVVGPFRSRLDNAWQWDWPYTHGATVSLLAQHNANVLSRRLAMKPFGALTQSLNGVQRHGLDDIVVVDAAPGSGIVVRPGEGVALLAGSAGLLNGSTFINYNIEATVLHYPPPGGYSKSRVVNR